MTDRLQRATLCLVFVWSALAPAMAGAAEWNPSAFKDEQTLEMRTVGPEEGEYWFPVWLVVIDDQLYVRLGSRAAGRIQKNKTAPYIAVKVAGQEFDRIEIQEAPQMAEAVAKAMADKYWSDIFVHLFSHPMTLRLVPAAGAHSPTP